MNEQALSKIRKITIEEKCVKFFYLLKDGERNVLSEGGKIDGSISMEALTSSQAK